MRHTASSYSEEWMPETEPLVCPTEERISVSSPDIGELEIRMVNETLASGWVSGRTPIVTQFESEFAKRINTLFAVSCNSGGSALHLMLRAAGIGPGDEVIVPTYTMIATAGAVSKLGAVPVFVDCEENTLNMDVASAEAAVTARTKGVIAVHLYGHPCHMEKLRNMCATYNLLLFEDAAEAIGAERKGIACGNLAQAAAFGFYANKTITAGEGGLITTNDESLASRLRSLRDYCFSPGRHFWHTDLGESYRMPSLCAALCLAQLRRLPELLNKRREVARRYHGLLINHSIPICSNTIQVDWNEHAWWHYWVRVRSRAHIREQMAKKGIETRPGFVPMHLQPCYQTGTWPYRVGLGGCPQAESVAREVILLPTHPLLSVEHQERVCSELMSALL